MTQRLSLGYNSEDLTSSLQPFFYIFQAPSYHWPASCLKKKQKTPASRTLYNTQQQSPTPAPGGQRQMLLERNV